MKNLKISRTLLIALLCCASIPLAAVNYDTSWTFVYDGSIPGDSFSVVDKFFDVKTLSNGDHFCVGVSNAKTILMKIDLYGKKIFTNKYNTNSTLQAYYNRQSGHSIFISKKNELIVGGERFANPWVMCLDTSGNIKWTSWYYDSLQEVSGSLLFGKGIINCIRELPDGKILAVAGDEYPDNGGRNLNNYAALLTLDSTGKVLYEWQWDNETGNTIGGFYVDQTEMGSYLISGNQSVFCLQSTGGTLWKNDYTFSLDGVGVVTNNIMRAKVLRDGSIIVAGQAYEGNCWNYYKRLIYDAWWSPIYYPDGSATAWDTAGYQSNDDHLYDFTQLINGNLVFVGTRGDRNGPAPLWVFVTDSTGKQLLMDKKFCVSRQGGTCGNTYPLSVSATNDTGFTIVGQGTFNTESGWDAFAVHFVPKLPVTAMPEGSHKISKTETVRVSISGTKVTFSIPELMSRPMALTLYTVSGKILKRSRFDKSAIEQKSITLEMPKVGSGVYLYKINCGDRNVCGRVVGEK